MFVTDRVIPNSGKCLKPFGQRGIPGKAEPSWSYRLGEAAAVAGEDRYTAEMRFGSDPAPRFQPLAGGQDQFRASIDASHVPDRPSLRDVSQVGPGRPPPFVPFEPPAGYAQTEPPPGRPPS